VDLFASSSNNKCQRFHSFHQTQGTEGADAFDRLSWAHSKRPCGQTHSEYLYVFQPMDLLLPTWLRLERDGAAGIAIVPMSPAAPWWTIMKCGYKHTPAPGDAFELCHQQDRTTKLMASTQHPVGTRPEPPGVTGYGTRAQCCEPGLITRPALFRVWHAVSSYNDTRLTKEGRKTVDPKSVLNPHLHAFMDPTTYNHSVRYTQHIHQSIMSRLDSTTRIRITHAPKLLRNVVDPTGFATRR